MNIKSLLLGSAAALAAVSGAHAADAIVAAEPEPMEYVRVCDAFGTGYFYIPGTETCLKISGYIRTQVNFADPGLFNDNSTWDARTRGYFTFSSKNDTEFGTLSGYINVEADDNADLFLDGAWIELAGFKVGYFYNWWDDYGLSGETDVAGSNLFNSIQYTYDAGSFKVGASVEETTNGPHSDDNVGVSALVGGTFGGVNAVLFGSYDFEAEEAAFEAFVTADIGPGTLGLMGIYATDPNVYWSESEWTVAAEYKLKATDKLTITPAVQYFSNVNFADNDDYKFGITAGYKITDGLKALATVNYRVKDGRGRDDVTDGFVRLQRDF